MKSLTCKEFIEFLDDYVTGNQPSDERSSFEAHLVICRRCREYIESYRATVALSRGAFALGVADLEAPVPRDVPEELVRAILRTRERSTPQPCAQPLRGT